MDITQFALENDLERKLKSAIETIFGGRSYQLFDGLQNGEVDLKLSFSGNSVVLSRIEQVKPVAFVPEEKMEPTEALTDDESPVDLGGNLSEVSQELPTVADAEPEFKPRRRRNL